MATITAQETTKMTQCPACEIESRMFSDDETVRSAVTAAERTRWSLWGCTCSPQSAAEALAFLERVTQ